MKRIQLHSKSDDDKSPFLNVLRDKDKKNTLSFLSSYPNLSKIILYGSLVSVLCLTLFYLVDPILANEWSTAAINTLPFNRTLIRNNARNSIIHYTHYISETPWFHHNETTSLSSHIMPLPVPAVKDGYKTGLIMQNEFEFIWQPPLVLSTKTNGGGIVFIASGCKKSITEWFQQSEDCQTCSPMPMQYNIVNYLRNHGYVVVVMKPFENRYKSQCWHQNDRKYISKAIDYVRKATMNIFNTTSSIISSSSSGSTSGSGRSMSGSTTPSIYAIGIENGGVFLGTQAESLQNSYQVKFTSICLMNSGIWHLNMKKKQYPSVIFSDLTRNGELCQHNNITISKLYEKGILGMQVISNPRIITPDYFVPVMNINDSSRLQMELLRNEYLWPASLVLLRDPGVERYKTEIIEVWHSCIV